MLFIIVLIPCYVTETEITEMNRVIILKLHRGRRRGRKGRSKRNGGKKWRRDKGG